MALTKKLTGNKTPPQSEDPMMAPLDQAASKDDTYPNASPFKLQSRRRPPSPSEYSPNSAAKHVPTFFKQLLTLSPSCSLPQAYSS